MRPCVADLSAIISAAAFANVDNDAPPPLDQLTNLRHQTEKNSKEQTLYRKRSDHWIDWEGRHSPPSVPVGGYH